MTDLSKNPAPLTLRHYVLAGALACTVAACVWAARIERDSEVEIAAPVTGAKRLGRSSSPETLASAVSAASAASAASTGVDPKMAWAPVPRSDWAPAVSLAGWSPPPPPPLPVPPPPPPPPPPTAPSFPYQVIGLLDDGVQRAMLASATNTLTVKAGDVIEGQWRVEKIQSSGLHLLWLPSKLSQTVNFRSIP